MESDAGRHGPPLSKTLVRKLVPQRPRRAVLRYAANHPVLSRAYFFVDPEMRHLRLTHETQLLIDGYMRSANTYAVFAFLRANPEVRLAHHLHRPVVFHRAVELGVPALLTIRAPAAVTASAVQFEPGVSVAGVFEHYGRFYDQLRPLLPHIVVADFTEVTADFGAVTKRVNDRFGTGFTPYVKTQANDAAVFSEVDRFSARYFGPEGFESKVSRPSAKRVTAEEFLERLTPEERNLLDRANGTYHAIVSGE